MTRRLLVWAIDHRADLLAALVYCCLAYLSFNALADYANAHHLFPHPYGGWAFAVAIDGTVLYAFISFRHAQILASLLLLAGALTSYILQQWHASGDPHPAVVAGVVPAAMVLVTFAWHQIRSWRPAWEPVPTPSAVPQPVTVPAPADPPSGPEHPVETRPKAAQGAPRSARPAALGRPTTWSPTDDPRIATLLDEGLSPNAIRNQLGLTDKQYRKVSDWHKQRRQLVPSANGHGGKA